MQSLQQSRQNQADSSRRDDNDPTWRNRPFHADYNSTLVAILEQCRSELDREYFALLNALQNNQSLKTRYLFFQFYKALLRYISKNRIALYGYLEKLYQDDAEKITVIETNKVVINAVADVITKTLARYVSPSAEYNEEFHRDLCTIWTILKKQHKQ